MLINAYVAQLARRIGWDFEDESPGNDARGFLAEGALPPDVETHLVNAVLTNGARYYVDHAHPELSTPECADAREVVVFDKAAEEILRQSMVAAQRVLPPGGEVIVHKNNSDGKGNCYGCHENYLMAREVPFGRIVAQVTPHFVTRQIFCGAGKVGLRGAWDVGRSGAVPAQPARRLLRGGGRARDHAEAPDRQHPRRAALRRQKYRRLHVIVGDANLSEVATFLKVGTTALVLAMIEDDVLPADMALERPGGLDQGGLLGPHACGPPSRPGDGRRVTALEVQWQLLDQARKYERERGLECVGEEVGAEVLRRWEEVLTGLETDRSRLANQLDWVAKDRLLDGYRERHGLAWDDARLRALDLQYHDLRPEKSLFARAGMERLTTDDEVTRAMTEPPETTRAYFRGSCLQKWPTTSWPPTGIRWCSTSGRPPAPGADDGTAAWNGGPCG